MSWREWGYFRLGRQGSSQMRVLSADDPVRLSVDGEKNAKDSRVHVCIQNKVERQT